MRKVVLLGLILLINLCKQQLVFADQIFSSTNAGGAFGRGTKEPKYKIEFHSEDAPFHPDDDQDSVIMPNNKGEKFLCFLPKVEKSKTEKIVYQQNTSSLIMESEKFIKLKTPDELLDLLKEGCLIRQEGWWTYEFCYQKKLRQIHIEDEKMVQEFVLGVYDEEATTAHNQNQSDVSTVKDPRSRDASQRYHPHQYTNGTLCDLTNEPRETEVRFVCSEPRVMISSITELSTCKYAVIVQSPMLCKHPLFQEEKPVWHTINCNALPNEQKDPQMENSFQDEEITMVTETENEHFPTFESEEYAT